MLHQAVGLVLLFVCLQLSAGFVVETFDIDLQDEVRGNRGSCVSEQHDEAYCSGEVDGEEITVTLSKVEVEMGNCDKPIAASIKVGTAGPVEAEFAIGRTEEYCVDVPEKNAAYCFSVKVRKCGCKNGHLVGQLKLIKPIKLNFGTFSLGPDDTE